VTFEQLVMFGNFHFTDQKLKPRRLSHPWTKHLAFIEIDLTDFSVYILLKICNAKTSDQISRELHYRRM